jgi:hypothetical protein
LETTIILFSYNILISITVLSLYACNLEEIGLFYLINSTLLIGHYIDYNRIGVFFSNEEHLSLCLLYTWVKARARGLTDGSTRDFCSFSCSCCCGFLGSVYLLHRRMVFLRLEFLKHKSVWSLSDNCFRVLQQNP